MDSNNSIYRGFAPYATFGTGKKSHQPKFALSKNTVGQFFANAIFSYLISLMRFCQCNFWLFNFITAVQLTRIFGAYGPIMFALRLWVGFGSCFELTCIAIKDTQHHVFGRSLSSIVFGRTLLSIVFGRTLLEYCVRKDTFRVLCWEGHFLSIVFGRTHCIMFGRTLFRI